MAETQVPPGKTAVVFTEKQSKKVNKGLEEAGVNPKNVQIADLAQAGAESGKSSVKNLPSQGGQGSSSPR